MKNNSYKRPTAIVSILIFTVVTAGSSIAAKPKPNSSVGKYNRCAEAKGATFHPVHTSKGTGEKCCYPRNKKTGLKTCIKCIYPGGGNSGDNAICTKNQFKSVMDTPNLDSQNLPTTNAPPKPLTRTEILERGRLNPGSTPGEMAKPEAPTSTPAQRARDTYYMERQGFAPK